MGFSAWSKAQAVMRELRFRQGLAKLRICGRQWRSETRSIASCTKTASELSAVISADAVCTNAQPTSTPEPGLSPGRLTHRQLTFRRVSPVRRHRQALIPSARAPGKRGGRFGGGVGCVPGVGRGRPRCTAPLSRLRGTGHYGISLGISWYANAAFDV
jgi:hypothetical protein